MLGTYHLTSLFDILREIHFIYEPVKLWQFVLEKACQIVQAEAGSFYAMSPDGQFLTVNACYGVDQQRLSQIPFKVGSGICGWVAQYKQPALVNDVKQDNRFNQNADLVTGFKTRSILCVPIFSSTQDYGVLELFNRKNGLFSPQEQEFMTLLGRQTGVVYHSLMLMAEVRRSKVLLESLLENLSGGLIAMDNEQRLTILNPAAGRILQINHEGQVGKLANEVLSAQPWFLQTLQNTLSSKTTASRQEAMADIGAEHCKIGYTTILIADHEKNILGSGVIFQKLSH